MPQTSTPPMNRTTVQRLHLALVGGLVAVVTVFGALFYLGVAPMLPAETTTVLISYVIAAASLGPLLFAWFWARPRVPERPPDLSVEEYWKGPEPGAKALLLWVLWEGSAMTGAVGALLTGSLIPATTALLALALLLTHGPGFFEGR